MKPATDRPVTEQSYQAPDPTAMASSAKADEPAPPDAKVAELRIKPSDNGGFVVECIKATTGKRGMSAAPSIHAFQSGDDLMSYVTDTLGIAPPGEETPGEDEGAEGEPPAGGPDDSGAAPMPPPGPATASGPSDTGQ
jgi:hypothetical protein